jgi:bifunctional non-homologous end joining protein LigD
LVRMKGKAAGNKNWLLIKEKDEQARSARGANILDERPESVASGRSMEEIAAGHDKEWKGGRMVEQRRPEAKPEKAVKSKKTRSKKTARPRKIDAANLIGARKAALPQEFKPQLATLVSEVPKGEDWLHEIKFDGYRVLCMLERAKAHLLSRNGNDWTRKLSRVASAAVGLSVSEAILDGELVALKADGASDFQSLQNAL